MKALISSHIAVILLMESAFCVALGAQATRPEAPAKSIAELKNDARKRLAGQWDVLPSVGQRDAADVVYFKMVGDRLLVGTNLPHSLATQSIAIRGYSGQAVYRYAPSRLGAGGFLVLERYDFSDPDLVDLHEMALSTPEVLQLVQDIEMGDRTQTVELIQGPTEEQGVGLHIQTVDEASGQVIVSLKLQAPSLQVMRREHRHEFEKYLRPLLHSLGGETAVFGVDEKLAWQIVSDSYRPPADIQEKAKKIVENLNSDSYPARTAAQEALTRLGEPAALYLMGIDRKSLSGEQSARVGSFLHAYQPASDEQLKSLRRDIGFLIDALSTEDDALRAEIFQHLQSAAGQAVKFDINMNPKDRAAAIEKLREQFDPAPRTVPSTQK